MIEDDLYFVKIFLFFFCALIVCLKIVKKKGCYYKSPFIFGPFFGEKTQWNKEELKEDKNQKTKMAVTCLETSEKMETKQRKNNGKLFNKKYKFLN